ncbi:MAG TPA: N4-gp56 family major capsid protein [Burkholderiaceae bacterium]|nr:N4-gp56 family major capsid protein [Burkholderiaceae bacterium]
MARTTILPTDPNKRKAWSAKVAEDSIKEQYYARLEGEEGSNSAVVRKTDLEAGKGDEVVTALVAKLRGAPITEGKKLEGAEFKLSNASHTMRVNEFRQGVNVGARIEQSRIGYNLKKQGRDRLTDYISELYEEVIAMAANGGRGVGAEIQHFPIGQVGYPNAFRAPDAAHYFVGTDNTKTFATLVNTAMTDTLNLKTLNKLRTKAKKMLGGQPNSPVKIDQIVKGGKKMYVLAVCPEVMQDIRDDVGTAGWFEAQKALTAAIGKEAEIFKGGAGMFNGVLVDEVDTVVKFNNAGAGANLNAVRSLFLGANAIVVAHGTKGMADGMTVSLTEDSDDRGHDAVLDFEIIFGADKSAFNGMDYGMITVDSNFTVAA